LVKKTLILLIPLSAGLGWYLFHPRDQASALKAEPTVADSESFARKLLELTAAEKSGSTQRIEFRESEVDAYLQHELAPLFPNGLKQVDVQLLQDSIAANSRINFDEMESAGGGNSLMSALFRGEHTLDVVATLKTQNHSGSYEIAKVSLDQREIPKPLVDLLMQKYVVSKYPAAKPNTPFPLPYNIEKVDLLPGKAIVHQSRK
jgi:hypothetical protein